MIVVEILVVALLAIGTLFVVVGTLGVLRLPDLPTRLHAVAKADNLGLGCIVVALSIHAIATGEGALGVTLKLLLVWALALLATAANSHLVASRRGEDASGTGDDAQAGDDAADGDAAVDREPRRQAPGARSDAGDGAAS